MNRKVAVVTTSRADYGHLYWPLRDLAAHPDLQLQLIALGPHLSHEYGSTIHQIEQDGFAIEDRIECLLSSDSDVGMAKTIGLATLSLADSLARLRPDLLLLIADRYEMLAPASVAVALRIPIAHIEGGEISQGAIDDSIRNALTKLSHLHFTSTETARRRVIAMGEEEWRVHRAGSPSLDHLRRSRLKLRHELESQLQLDLQLPFALVGFHPATIARNTTREADALFQALAHFTPPTRFFFCYPNADAGSRELVARTHAFCQLHPNSQVFVNLDPISYWSLLSHAQMLIGNSSSGIMEAASFAVPVVNVGIRQQGRERAANVLDCAADCAAIQQHMTTAISPAFRNSLAGMQNPYGDGYASGRIVQAIASADLNESFLIKKTL